MASIVQPIIVPTPGKLGINTTEADQTLGPEWCTVAKNMELRDRIMQGRRGFNTLTASAAGDTLHRLYYWASQNLFIGGAPTAMYDGAVSTGAWTDRSGAIATNGNMLPKQIVEFGGDLYAWTPLTVSGSTNPIKKIGAGNWADFTASSGSIAQGGAAVAAFSRVFAVDNVPGTIIEYCALNDIATWDGDGGSIDLTNIMMGDTIIGLAQMSSTLVVFGRRQILFYADGSGSEVGVDPDQMYLVDQITGIGLLARDSIQHVDGDIVFLSHRGVESLQRLLVNKDNQLIEMSWQVRKDLETSLANNGGTTYFNVGNFNINSGYNSATKQYFLIYNNRSAGVDNDVYVFHFADKTQDEQGRLVVPATRWGASSSSNIILEDVVGFAETLANAFYSLDNELIYTYVLTEVQDGNDDEEIYTEFETGWLQIPDFKANLGILKALTWQFSQETSGETVTPTFHWAVDYAASTANRTQPSSTDTVQRVTDDPDDQIEGLVFKFGIYFDNTSSGFGGGGIKLKQLGAFFKIARIAIDR